MYNPKNYYLLYILQNTEGYKSLYFNNEESEKTL